MDRGGGGYGGGGYGGGGYGGGGYGGGGYGRRWLFAVENWDQVHFSVKYSNPVGPIIIPYLTLWGKGNIYLI